jgi:hypothetical protein
MTLPFNKTGDNDTHLGDLMHIDIWGKYDISSINGCQYYLLMVDDALRFIMVEFLKTKDQATQKVKNYFTHLELQGKSPKAMCIDHGKRRALVGYNDGSKSANYAGQYNA